MKVKALKKVLTVLMVTFIGILSLSVFNTVKAAISTTPKYLTIKQLRSSGYGYRALEKNIWKIVETNNSGTTANYNNTIYCLKAGPGFGSSEFGNGTPTVRPYTRYFDMTDSSFINSNDIYRNVLPTDSTTYNALLWILEHAYVPGSDNAAEYKTSLLNAAGIRYEDLTDDDIDVVQQLAIWHFTNTGSSYDVEMDGSNTFELYVNLDAGIDDNYIALSDDFYWGDEGVYRSDDAITLYNYLVDTALSEAQDGYTPTTNTGYTLAKNLGSTLQESGNNYIVGPFKIEGNRNSNVTLNGTFTNGSGSQINVIRYQNADGTTTYNSLKDTIGNEFYIVVSNTTNIDTVTLNISGSYSNTNITFWSVEGADTADQPVAIVERTEENYQDSVTYTRPPEEIFDLALRKFIASITSEGAVTTPENRVPTISDAEKEALADGDKTTANKVHSKTPLVVSTGDTVLYTIRVYNEGNIDGIVTEITDYLPNGLELKEGSSINTQYNWHDNGDGTVTTDYLAGQVIPAFDGSDSDAPHYLDVQIECVVTARVQSEDTNLKNIAEITGATNEEGEEVPDRDSTPDNVDVPDYGNESQEDDDDFEDLVILGKYFDLSLRKYITNIDGKAVTSREPVVDTTSLSSGTTAIYNHDKTPLGVKVGDEIIYTIRVYNEGQLDGYVTEITDHLPTNLEFVNDSFNTERGWVLESDGRTVKTQILTDELIRAYDGGSTLDYVEVQIKCRVTSGVTPGEKLTNIAEISGFTDGDGYQVTDRDSQEDNITLPNDNTLPNYKDTEINRGDEYIPGQQDDDDFEKVYVQSFDLALRKFITGVNADVINSREPVFSIDNGEYTYTHTKDPVMVKSGDTVIYTLRIYNEGDIAGYAEEVKDDIPEGLEFLPDNTTNINYRWVMYDANGNETENVEEAVTIRTDYLSKAQEDATSRDNLIEAFDPDTMSEPDYKEVRVAFRVTEPNSSDRVIINTAEISEDADEAGEPIDDEDSTPDNDEPEEDDIDIEKVIVEEFDLALRKFITTITSADGQTVTTPENREPQITIDTINDLVNGNTTTLEKTHSKDPIQVMPGDKVVYTIRIYNEGTIDGYATEITDYLPDGLRFVEDSSINAQYGWTNPSGDGKTIITTTLADNLLNGVEGTNVTYIDVQIECEVIAEYGNTETSLKNVAEITKAADEDGNEQVVDRDSTPDNLTEEQIDNYNPTPYPDKSESGEGYEDDDDYEELVIPAATGDFELKLIKVNGLGNRLSGATFKVEELNAEGNVINTYEGLTTDGTGEVVTDRIAVSGVGTRIFVITEENAPDGYELLGEPIRLEVTVELVDGVYTVTNVSATRPEEVINESNLQGENFNAAETLTTTINLETNNLNVEETAQSVSIENGAVKSIEVIDNTIEITIENSYFDLALRKFITQINETSVEPSREPQISEETKQNVFNRTTTTLEKTHTKTPLQVNTGDSVIYTIRVYNEGEIAGYATEITDYLPNGLALKADSTINTQYGWVAGENGEVTTDITSPNTTNPNRDTIYADRKEGDDKVIIDAFDGSNLDYIDVQIECEVVATKGETNISLKNVAEITGDLDKDKNEVEDRDSTPDNVPEKGENYNPGESEKGWGYEDDDDYEELVLPPATGDFKIKLIKVNGLGNRLQDAVFKVEEVNTDGTVINTYDDLRTNENGEILIENLTITGEGTRRFVISEKEAPEGYTVLEESIIIDVQITLENGEYTITANRVVMGAVPNGEQLGNLEEETTTEEVEKLASAEDSTTEKATSAEENTKEETENSISRENTKENTEMLTSTAIKTEQTSSNNTKLTNESSIMERTQLINKITRETKESVVTTNLTQTLYGTSEVIGDNTEQNGNETNNTSEDSNENSTQESSSSDGPVKSIIINGNTIEITIENTYFDLSLRKFITGVNDEEITGRVPIFSIVDGEYTYTHPKDPVEVATEDTVIYTIRVYNEGEIAGYAEEVKDDLPEGLEFLPDNEINTEYRWIMYDANGNVTENVEEAVSIRTDYLSKAQEEETGRDNLLAAFNPDTMSEPDYRDLQIAFRVTEPNTSDRVLINTAEISEDSDEEGNPVEDKDSTPDNNEEEDDQDIEKVKVTYFDLALKKIISEVTMTLDGETTVEETGHTFEDNPEKIVKIELGNHKIQTSVLKFTYRIRITNEGNKAGYAYEIKDYIPEGLEFLAEDNNEHWTLSEDGKTVTSDELAETLLEPGESAEIEITLRWINGQNNLGVKTNWAEISEDSDDDIDSTPDNFERGEDDIDDAEVVLSIVTGIGEHYIAVIAGTLAILATGLVLIKKYVL